MGRDLAREKVMTEQAIHRRIRNLVEANYSDLYITKKILVEFGLEASDTESRLKKMRAKTVDFSKVIPAEAFDAHQDEDERRFDANLGHALGLDWGGDD